MSSGILLSYMRTSRICEEELEIFIVEALRVKTASIRSLVGGERKQRKKQT